MINGCERSGEKSVAMTEDDDGGIKKQHNRIAFSFRRSRLTLFFHQPLRHHSTAI